MDAVASDAGQLHSDEMAINGYLSHWTMDGRKPDQRYNDASGKDAVMENAFVNIEGNAMESSQINKLPLHSSQVFHRYELDQIESSFFNEQPPNDGHRQNIINPLHTAVGIGLSFASSFGAGVRTACAQEFINHYGEFGDIPKQIKPGETFTLKGKLGKGVHLKLIDVRFEAAPTAMTIAELNKTSSYGISDKILISYFADATQTNDPIAVKTVDAQEEFSQPITIDKEWQPGLYYICVWASVNNSEDAIVSTRTLLVTPP